ncbi:MAG: PA-phosphatase [Bacteroidetes bacterium]|nr:PA-phosphatase [Bacteroidota bacterium]
MPTTVFAVIIYMAPEAASPLNLDQSFDILLLLGLTTFFIPLLSLGFLKLSSSIKNFELESRKERIMPFLFMTLFYGLTAYMFIFKIRVNDFLTVILISISVLVLSIAIITFYIKVCVHSTAIAAVVGFTLGIIVRMPSASLIYPLIGGIILLGAIMSARLSLNVQTPAEVAIGSGLGFIFGLAPILIFT